jgi:hypothetical protein
MQHSAKPARQPHGRKEQRQHAVDLRQAIGNDEYCQRQGCAENQAKQIAAIRIKDRERVLRNRVAGRHPGPAFVRLTDRATGRAAKGFR